MVFIKRCGKLMFLVKMNKNKDKKDIKDNKDINFKIYLF